MNKNLKETDEVSIVAKVKLVGPIAKYYKFLKDMADQSGYNDIDKFIIESGILDMMRSIWTMLLSSIISEEVKNYENNCNTSHVKNSGH
jgi:hypothetical protein